MAPPLIPKNVFPNVPNVPGVPPLSRGASQQALLEPANVFTSQLRRVPYLQGILQAASAEVWGIFTKDGTRVLEADTFQEASVNANGKVARFFLERGSFANYNKVDESDEVGVVMIKTGTFDELGEFLDELESIKNSIDLYDVVTPERAHTDVNLESYNYSRTRQDGVNMIVCDLSFVEIRQRALEFTNVTIPDGATTQDRGLQQAEEPQQSVLFQLAGGIG